MKTAIALGTFDGIHIAHRVVLDLPEAYEKTAVTFVKPPKMFFEEKNELLMTFEDKVKFLKELGFSNIVALDFETVKNTEAREFLDFLYKTYNPRVISCGFNYRFGKGGKGDTEILRQFCDEKGIELKLCEPVKIGDETVSSTLIRSLLKKGEIEKANKLMGRPFSFSAQVIKGDKRGRTIGFPTLNQKYPEDLVKIRFGVYITKVLLDGKEYDGITNVGIRPTFQSDYVISETFVKDFSGNVYGQTARIMPVKFLRDEIKFTSLEELKSQIEKDLN